MSRRRDFRLYRQRSSVGRRFGRIAFWFICLFAANLAVTTFLLASISVGSDSMAPGISPKERFFFSPLAYGPIIPFSTEKLAPIRTPMRGDLVIVRPPYFTTTAVRRIASPIVSFFTARRVRIETPGHASFEESSLVRRVVAVPGDAVRVEGFVAFVRPAGSESYREEQELARRPYAISFDPLPEGWNRSLPASGSMDEVVLREDEYFLMADNRSVTNDSRYWGPLGIASFTGRILLCYWPFGSIGVPR